MARGSSEPKPSRRIRRPCGRRALLASLRGSAPRRHALPTLFARSAARLAASGRRAQRPRDPEAFVRRIAVVAPGATNVTADGRALDDDYVYGAPGRTSSRGASVPGPPTRRADRDFEPGEAGRGRLRLPEPGRARLPGCRGGTRKAARSGWAAAADARERLGRGWLAPSRTQVRPERALRSGPSCRRHRAHAPGSASRSCPRGAHSRRWWPRAEAMLREQPRDGFRLGRGLEPAGGGAAPRTRRDVDGAPTPARTAGAAVAAPRLWARPRPAPSHASSARRGSGSCETSEAG